MSTRGGVGWLPVRNGTVLLGFGLALSVALTACGSAATPGNPALSARANAGGQTSSVPASVAVASSAPLAKASPSGQTSAAPVSASAPAAATSANPKTALNKLTVIYGTVASAYLALWYGQDAGVFAKHGLDVQGIVVSTSGGAMAAAVSGQGEIFQGNGSDVLSAATNGANLVILGMVAPVYSYKLMVKPDIKTPADLKGKKIAIQGIGDVTDVATRVALQKVGIDPDKDVTLVPVAGAAANRAAALMGGAVDGVLSSPPDDLTLQSQGFRSLLDLAALGLPSANQSITVRRDWLASHKDIAQRYVDGMVESIRDVKKDRAKSMEILKKHLKQDDETKLAYTYDYISQKALASQPFPKVEQFKDPIAMLSKSNPKIASFDVSSILDPSFVQSAVDRGLDKG